jgi:acyl dehydratase
VRTFTSFDDLTAAVGEDIGVSDWLTIEQDRVDAFAEATGDHQWIHVDVPRATAGPFGGTIAHGYLTLSLIPMLGAQVFGLETPGAKLNYGVNKVRFPAPLPVGSRIRAHVKVADVADVPAGKQVTFGWAIEIDGGSKPACVAETVVLLLP